MTTSALPYFSIKSSLKHQCKKLSNQVLFIEKLQKNEILILNTSKDEIIQQLKKAQIDTYEESYDYLLKQSIHSLSYEKISQLEQKLKEKMTQYEALQKQTPQTLWSHDLKQLRQTLIKSDYEKSE